MNRQQRRAAAAERRPDTRMRVETYRVPPGRVAITFDLPDRPPSTLSIRAAALAGVIENIGKLVAGKSYQQVLHLLVAAIEEGDAGNEDAWCGGLIGYWLTAHHPTCGAEMTARLSDALALDGRAHITLCGHKGGGIAIALGDRFYDLAPAVHRAREAGCTGTAIIAAEPRRQRPGGRA